MLSLVAGAGGCLDPILVSEVDVQDNHAPIVEGINPPPTFNRLHINFGANCPVQSFRVDLVDDADLDPLTLRYTLLVPREEQENGVREQLFEQDVLPLEQPVVQGDTTLRYPLPLRFELTRSVVVSALGGAELADLIAKAQSGEIEGQLLELRISDRGFLSSKNEPPAGGALFYLSWAIVFEESGCAAGGT